MASDEKLREILSQARRIGDTSDIYIQSGSPVFFRREGQLMNASPSPTDGEIDEMVSVMMKTDGARAALYDKEEKDLSYSVKIGKEVIRYRVNICLSRKGTFMVMRPLKPVNTNPLSLGVPHQLVEVSFSTFFGIILIAGPTGSGKSTTLSSVIGHLASKKAANIITIEDPIEYVIPDGRGNVAQREVGKDTLSFERGLRAAMRQHPDIILVGEVRDPETAIAAIQAAKSGHLVFTTIHTFQATQIPGRIASMFPIEKQNWVIHELADVIVACLVQSLVRSKDKTIRLVTEMIETKDRVVRDMIKAGNYENIRERMRNGEGGFTLNQSLFCLAAGNVISWDDARSYSNDITSFDSEKAEYYPWEEEE